MSATRRRRQNGLATVRNEHDFYATPGWVTDLLIAELVPQCYGFKWGEPAAGSGAIIERFVLAGGEPSAWEWAELTEGRDYLKDGLTGKVDWIIANPPFILAQEFITRSLGEAKFNAYLLRLNFFGSKKRKQWWRTRIPTHLFVLSERPRFVYGKGTDATEYAWFVWDYVGLCRRRPGIYVI